MLESVLVHFNHLIAGFSLEHLINDQKNKNKKIKGKKMKPNVDMKSKLIHS